MKSTQSILGLACALALAAPVSAMAATATGQFNVTIKITPQCSANTGSGQAGAITSDTYSTAGADIDFGSHSSAETANVDAAGSAGATNGIAVTCTKGTGYTIGLTPGNSNTTGVGSMNGITTTNTDAVPYSLYQDAGRTKAWGNVSANMLSDTGTGTAKAHPVYGRVLGANLNKAADRYADRVTVTVTY